MGADSSNFINSTRSHYAMARSLLISLSTFVGQVTFKIKRGTPDETIAEIGRKWKLDDKQRQFLTELGDKNRRGVPRRKSSGHKSRSLPSLCVRAQRVYSTRLCRPRSAIIPNAAAAQAGACLGQPHYCRDCTRFNQAALPGAPCRPKRVAAKTAFMGVAS
jgi:hypothetical protein